MRLISTKTLTFKETHEHVKYAIISHRWSDGEEVLYEDFARRHARPKIRVGHGWTKIEQGCRLAREEGIEWLWIDTCCINQTSSAELAEAINSMYKWYTNSAACYVFLNDVSSTEGRIEECVADDGSKTRVFAKPVLNHASSIIRREITEDDVPVLRLPAEKVEGGVAFSEGQFKMSEWFRRGWTLQELLAPRTLHFYNENFDFIGTKDQLQHLVAAATGIQGDYLLSSWPVHEASIAERMCWASRRKTTREEDIAYCLLGLFDVNMPLLYGEGAQKAFVRLQLELIKKSDDETIFAWFNAGVDPWYGLLAPSPGAFAEKTGKSESQSPHVSFADYTPQFRQPYAMTNKGLELTLEIPHGGSMSGKLPADGFAVASFGYILLPLNCMRITTMRDGSHVREALAVRFACPNTDPEKHGVLLANRLNLVLGEVSYTDAKGVRVDFLSGQNAPFGVVGRGRTKACKVYFRQSGV